MMSDLLVGNAWKRGNEEDITEISDCYCPSCGGANGRALMLPTKIPAFREVIIMTLHCRDCGFRNSEVSFGGKIQPKGVIVTLRCNDSKDLNRQIVKSDSTAAKFPRLDLEIPASAQRGVITTVEGLLSRVAQDLSKQQPDRLRMGDTENFYRCKRVIDQIQQIIGVADDSDDSSESSANMEPAFPFDLILDDPAGNASIENLRAPHVDSQLKVVKYERTPTQDMSLGLQPSNAAKEDATIRNDKPSHKNQRNFSSRREISIGDDFDAFNRHETVKFQTTCSYCQKQAETCVCVIDIPHFKEVVIMSLVCEHCGFKSSEIKGGGAIPKYGSRITVTVSNPDDLGRDVLKSDTAGIQIPELELELVEGGLDGVYTTVEGLLNKMRESLESANPFGSGDSVLKQHHDNDGRGFSAPESGGRFIAFLERLRNMASGKEFPFTLVITDPLANSFVGPVPSHARALAETQGSKVPHDKYVDHQLQIQEFERTFEQNEGLGLNDMKTEGY